MVRHDSRRRGLGSLLGRLFDLPAVGPWIARLARFPGQIPFVTARVTRFHAWLLRHTGGRLRRSWLFAAGQPVISLTTTGRTSGAPRSTAVACFADGDDLVLAAMNLGSTRQPGWALNLIAEPDAEITIDGGAVAVKARRPAGEEYDRLWARWVDLQPSADAFRELSGREIPLFVLARRTPV